MVEVVVRSKQGLHARPASIIVDLASRYSGEVYLIKEGNRINAKSIMNIMSMGLLEGAVLQIEAIGENSEDMELRLKNLIEGITE